MIAFLKHRYNSKDFLLGDLTFFQDSSKYRYEELCREIIRRDLGINWWCQTRTSLITKKRASLLRKAGCVQVALGIEVGSQTVLDSIKKEARLDDTTKACRLLENEGISVQGYFMIGLPEEDLNKVMRTIKFLEFLVSEGLVDSTNIAHLVPFPCLDMYNNPSACGIRIVDRDFSNYFMGVSRYLNPYPVYETKYLSRFQIHALWELALATATRSHRLYLEKKLKQGREI